jgi:PTH1 family peptidyl-tRNA hydrolase
MAIRLLIGLGNPGRRYAETRHNVGFRVVDELAARHGVGSSERTELADLVRLDLDGGLPAAKPLTYMNRSGAALDWLLDRFGLEIDRVLVVVDDLDLQIGRMRLRRNGGPGTHNGLRDLCRVAGTAFPRLRVGIRGEDEPHDLAEWVTSPFEAHEREAAELAIGRAADAVEAVVRGGLATAMNVFNRADPVQGDVQNEDRGIESPS